MPCFVWSFFVMFVPQERKICVLGTGRQRKARNGCKRSSGGRVRDREGEEGGIGLTRVRCGTVECFKARTQAASLPVINQKSVSQRDQEIRKYLQIEMGGRGKTLFFVPLPPSRACLLSKAQAMTGCPTNRAGNLHPCVIIL